MKITFNTICDILNSSDTTNSDVVAMILEYCGLKKSGKVKDRLEYLQFTYSLIYWDFNFSSLNTLMKERENRIKIKNELEKKQNLTQQDQLVLKGVSSKILYYNDLICLKSKTDILRDLDYYHDHPSALAKLLS